MANTPLVLNHISLAWLEGLYSDYLQDPSSAPPEWRHYFARLTNGDLADNQFSPGPTFHPYSVFNPPARRSETVVPAGEPGVAGLQESVDALIRSYRARGHIIAQVDPLRQPKAAPPELDPAYHGLTDADLDRPFA